MKTAPSFSALKIVLHVSLQELMFVGKYKEQLVGINCFQLVVQFSCTIGCYICWPFKTDRLPVWAH